MKNIRRTCNLIVDLEKFTFNKNKLSGVIVVGSNQVFSQTLSLIKINMNTYFKNLAVGLHVFYVFNMNVEFCTNWILFTIRSINLFFYT